MIFLLVHLQALTIPRSLFLLLLLIFPPPAGSDTRLLFLFLVIIYFFVPVMISVYAHGRCEAELRHTTTYVITRLDKKTDGQR
jgi:hypothetical protein